MRDDDAPGRVKRRNSAQAVDDIFVGEAVEAVASDALVVKAARQREDVVDEGMVAVKGGVEAGDLLHMRPGLARGEDAGDVVRLMQRRERRQLFQAAQHLVGDDHGLRKINAAMDDAVPGGDHFGVREGALAPGEDAAQRLGVKRRPGRLGAGRFMDLGAGAIADGEAPLDADHFGEADRQRPRRHAIGRLEQREFDRGGARVERDDAAAHLAPSGAAPGGLAGDATSLTALSPVACQWA